EKALAAFVTGFEKIISKSIDFHITLTKFKMRKLNIPSFTVTKIPICGQALASTINIERYSNDEQPSKGTNSGDEQTSKRKCATDSGDDVHDVSETDD
ncbi:hypothetical protein MKW92_023185, partial [Papaver armeniacum]